MRLRYCVRLIAAHLRNLVESSLERTGDGRMKGTCVKCAIFSVSSNSARRGYESAVASGLGVAAENMRRDKELPSRKRIGSLGT